MNTLRRSDPASTFRFLAERVSALGERAGVTIRPFTDPDLPHLRALPAADQRKLTAELENYLYVCERTVNSGYTPTDSSRLLWFALRTMGYLPPERLFDHVRNDQIVLINDHQHRQIFRNFAYFELCSYTLEELYACPWPDLYGSDLAFDADLAQAARALGPELGCVLRSTAPKHVAYELSSVFRYEISFQVAFIAGVRERVSGEAGGYLTLSVGTLRRALGGAPRGLEAGLN